MKNLNRFFNSKYDRFVFVPIGASEELVQLWRVLVVEFFVRQKLINMDFAQSLLGWKHSGFSIESGTKNYDDTAREFLSQYIVRAPVSLEKLSYDTQTDTLTWKAPKKGHFRGKEEYFSGLDFIARLTLHIPPKGKHLVRRYGVYSSRSHGTWKNRPALALRAAEGWYGREEIAGMVEAEESEDVSVSNKARRKAWARLLSKVYEIDIFTS
ncbi:MAG: transposase [Spirochaetales bacterium]|nr:transposase [Spirochaetales bacterium]